MIKLHKIGHVIALIQDGPGIVTVLQLHDFIMEVIGDNLSFPGAAFHRILAVRTDRSASADVFYERRT